MDALQNEDKRYFKVCSENKLLLEKRIEAYQQLCDIVYEKKGFTSEGIPKRETVERFGLMDEHARQLLDESGV